MTDSKARFNYRLRVSVSARVALESEWDRCRWVWNQCVEAARAAYTSREECGPARLDRMLTGWRAEYDWLSAGSSVVQQQTIRDYGRARAKALADIKNRLPMCARVGMPRFKRKQKARPTLNYTKRGFKIRDGRLILAGGIEMRVVWSRELPSDPSSVRVYRDSLGHWYASFVVSVKSQPIPVTDREIGIDWGVAEVATTTSDNHNLPHPAHGKRASAEIARHQRAMARRRPKPGQAASAGYREAMRRAAKTYKKIARQRQDSARKWAKWITRDFDRIAVEDFRPKFMAKSTLAGKAADGAIAAAKRELVNIARKHQRDLRLVHPAYTTMECGECGARTKHALPLSKRTYHCSDCGHSRSRDKNSATVMLVRAGFNPAGVESRRPERPPAVRAA